MAHTKMKYSLPLALVGLTAYAGILCVTSGGVGNAAAALLGAGIAAKSMLAA